MNGMAITKQNQYIIDCNIRNFLLFVDGFNKTYIPIYL